MNEVTFRRVATFHSPFHSCFGCPRQGCCESVKGRIELESDLSPDYLRGLENFSHVWVLFLFDRNEQKEKVQKQNAITVAGAGSEPPGAGQQLPGRSSGEKHAAVEPGADLVVLPAAPSAAVPSSAVRTAAARSKPSKACVKPPRLGDGDASGVFATRAPHRPNNIGMTVMRIERIEGRTVIVAGADVVDKTFIVDLKPYHILDAAPVAEFLNCSGGGGPTSTDEVEEGELQQHDRSCRTGDHGGANNFYTKTAKTFVEKVTVKRRKVDDSSSRAAVPAEVIREERTTASSSCAGADAALGTSTASSCTTSSAAPTTTSEVRRPASPPASVSVSHYPSWCLKKQQSKAVQWTDEAVTQLHELVQKRKPKPTQHDLQVLEEPQHVITSTTSCGDTSTCKTGTNTSTTSVSSTTNCSRSSTRSSSNKLFSHDNYIYSDVADLKKAITEVVSMDIRTQQHKRNKKQQKQRSVWAFYFDHLNVLFRLKKELPSIKEPELVGVGVDQDKEIRKTGSSTKTIPACSRRTTDVLEAENTTTEVESFEIFLIEPMISSRSGKEKNTCWATAEKTTSACCARTEILPPAAEGGPGPAGGDSSGPRTGGDHIRSEHEGDVVLVQHVGGNDVTTPMCNSTFAPRNPNNGTHEMDGSVLDIKVAKGNPSSTSTAFTLAASEGGA
ncbi:unnamed protein product [Amoebophrya sp. A120]|nr:unnamed protein product [Amoebophrya sp. A120]|eukprot:GSA120T00009327001.1